MAFRRVSLYVFPSICFPLWVSPLSATGGRPAPGCFLGFPPGPREEGGSAAAGLRPSRSLRSGSASFKTEGYPHREVCQLIGWTFTKVNRCLTDGHRALAERLAEIENGIGCAKLAPLLGALADGDASGDQLGLLRQHPNTRLDCRARLKSLRAADTPRHSAHRRE
jgi:hypothetical protein